MKVGNWTKPKNPKFKVGGLLTIATPHRDRGPDVYILLEKKATGTAYSDLPGWVTLDLVRNTKMTLREGTMRKWVKKELARYNNPNE